MALTSEGRQLVVEVSRGRREEIARIVGRMRARDRAAVQRALRVFADSAGAVPEQDWSLGWHLDAAGSAVASGSGPQR